MQEKIWKKVGDYIFLQTIGKGAFAEVYKCQHQPTKGIVAIKMVIRSEVIEQAQQIEKEIHVLKQLNHNNIVRMLDSQKTQKHYYLIFEYCQHGDFEHFINHYYGGKVPEYDAQKYIQQIIEGIKEMKTKKIVHRDLKLANILVNKDFELKIADFGLAQFLKSDDFLLKTMAGTPLNMDPLILEKKPYSEKCDIWSLGVIFYQILVGKLPFNPGRHAGINDLLELIRKQKVTFPNDIKLSEQVKDLIRRMLVYDQEKRISFEELFNNEWITGKFRVPDPYKKDHSSFENLSSSKLLESVYSHRKFETGTKKQISKETLVFEKIEDFEKEKEIKRREEIKKQQKLEKSEKRELIVVSFLAKIYEMMRNQVLCLREEVEKVKNFLLNNEEERFTVIQSLVLINMLRLLKSAMMSKTLIIFQNTKTVFEKSFQEFIDFILKNKEIIQELYWKKESGSEMIDLLKLLQQDYVFLFDELQKRQEIITKIFEQNAEGDYEKLLLDCLLNFTEHIVSSEFLDDDIKANLQRYNICIQTCQFLIFTRSFKFTGFSIDQCDDDKENININETTNESFPEEIVKFFEEGFSFKKITENQDKGKYMKELERIKNNIMIINLGEHLDIELDLSLKSFESLLSQRTKDLKERSKGK